MQPWADPRDRAAATVGSDLQLLLATKLLYSRHEPLGGPAPATPGLGLVRWIPVLRLGLAAFLYRYPCCLPLAPSQIGHTHAVLLGQGCKLFLGLRSVGIDALAPLDLLLNGFQGVLMENII